MVTFLLITGKATSTATTSFKLENVLVVSKKKINIYISLLNKINF